MSNEAIDQAMARYADGDEKSFELLYDQLSPRLHAFLLRQTRNAAAAEDLLQQTFLQIHRSRGHFKPGAPVVPWALAIARRLTIDSARRAQHRTGADEAVEEVAAEGLGPDAIASARQLHGKFQEELARLPASQRDAFIMMQAEGLSSAEAAAALGTTVSGVKLRAHRAYQTLRRVLGEVFERPEEI